MCLCVCACVCMHSFVCTSLHNINNKEHIPKEEDADNSFRAGLPGASSRMDSSRIPAGDLVTVGGGPLLLLSSIVLLLMTLSIISNIHTC